MANKRTASSGRRSSTGGGAIRFMGGLIAGAVLATGAGYLYMHPGVFTHKKSAAAEWHPPLLPSAAPANKPQTATRRQPPFGASEDAFEGGARVYHAQCAQCHGVPGHDAAAKKGAPAATQFWNEEAAAVLHGQEAGDLYIKTANGVPRNGMPAYRGKLTETQLWQVSLLLAGASGDLPDPVLHILKQR